MSSNSSGPGSAGPSSEAAAAATPSSSRPRAQRPIPSALRPLLYMGIPRGVLTWKPRLPSRNWSIFLVTTGSLTYLWWDDRRRCKKLMDSYKEQVRWVSEQKIEPHEWPRRLKVYTAQSPGDEDYDVGVLWFKKYMKPVLAAAGLDWEIRKGRQYGGLGKFLAEDIHTRRRKLAGLEEWSTSPQLAPDGTGIGPFTLTPQQMLERELEGGVVLIGRPAFKEWMWGLKEGWTTEIPVKASDPNDALAAELTADGVFGDPQISAPSHLERADTESPPLQPGLQTEQSTGGGASQRSLVSRFGSALFGLGSPGTAGTASNGSTRQVLPAPSEVPAQPPVCFVDFTNLIGWRNIPRRMVRFFRRRDDVKLGGDAALRVIYGSKEYARAFEGPVQQAAEAAPPQGGDLDWGLEGERFYPPFFAKIPQDVAKAKESYYKALPDRLKAAREIAGGREMTKAEARDPPPKESDLKVERFEKERDWRKLLAGFDIIRPDAPVAWDPKLQNSIRVFEDVEPVAPGQASPASHA